MEGSGSTRGFDVREATFILIFTLFALALFLYGAGRMPLTDPDEGRYAEIAREMASGGGWIVPTLFGDPYLEKPPLLYWGTAAAFRAFGVSELSARIVPALAAAFGVFVAGAFAAAYIAPLAGRLATVVIALSALYVVIARTLITDMPFAVSIAAALFSFFAFRERPTLPRALGFWIFLGMATLSKGPAAFRSISPSPCHGSRSFRRGTRRFSPFTSGRSISRGRRDLSTPSRSIGSCLGSPRAFCRGHRSRSWRFRAGGRRSATARAKRASAAFAPSGPSSSS
jgi:hypothetical protein